MKKRKYVLFETLGNVRVLDNLGHIGYAINDCGTPFGFRHNKSGIKPTDIPTIRNLHSSGRFNQTQLAEQYNVCRWVIQDILLNLDDNWFEIGSKPNKKGRIYVDMYDYVTNNKLTLCVARLVLTAFVRPCPIGMEACHNDGNPSNNNLSNLRWDTHQSNMDDCVVHGTVACGERSGHAILSDEIVYRIRSLYALGYRQCEIARMFSLPLRHIHKIIKRQIWKHLP